MQYYKLEDIDNKIEKVEQTLCLGLDDTLRLEQPLGWAEEYVVEGVKNINTKIRSFFLENGQKEYIEKIFYTADGELKTVVQKTADWPHGDNIPVFSDFNVSRAKEFLVKSKRLKRTSCDV